MWRRRLAWGLGVTIAAALTVRFVAIVRWDSQSSTLRQQLALTPAERPDRYSEEDVAGLPEPVVRFFHHVLKDGQPIARRVDLVTTGEFQSGTGAKGWKGFTATQRFVTTPPGFVWDAEIQMAPFIRVYVHDAYVEGHSEMRGKLMALFPVVDEAGTPELAAGQLHRYLGETMWFPTALLPGEGVVWRAIDDKSALATLSDRGQTVSLRFTFSADGDVTEVFASDRMRSIGGRYTPTPWAVSCGHHAERHEMRIPLWCEADWRLPEGPLPYWRGRVVDVAYTFAR